MPMRPQDMDDHDGLVDDQFRRPGHPELFDEDGFEDDDESCWECGRDYDHCECEDEDYE